MTCSYTAIIHAALSHMVCALSWMSRAICGSPQTVLFVEQKSKKCSVIGNYTVTSQYYRTLWYPQSHSGSLPPGPVSVARLCSHTENRSCVVVRQCQALSTTARCPPSLKPLPLLSTGIFLQFGIGLYFLVLESHSQLSRTGCSSLS